MTLIAITATERMLTLLTQLGIDYQLDKDNDLLIGYHLWSFIVKYRRMLTEGGNTNHTTPGIVEMLLEDLARNDKVNIVTMVATAYEKMAIQAA